MRRPRSTAPAGSTCSATSPCRCWPASIWFARCSATIWALGDFNAVRFISGGGPALSTARAGHARHPQCLRARQPGLGMATVLSALPLLIPLVDPADAPAEERPGAAVSLARRARCEPVGRASRRSLCSAPLLIVWTLLPLYNMVRVALQEKEDVFSSNVIPVTPSLHSFWTVFHEVVLAAGQVLGARWATASGSASSSLRSR